MAIVTVNPGEGGMKRQVTLKGGRYGTGLDNEAAVDLTKFAYPAQDRDLPGYDRDDHDGPWAFFLFRITLPDGGTALTRFHTNDIDRFARTLAACGCEIARDPGGGLSFDPDDVAPREVGGIEIKDPRQNPQDAEQWFNGDVVRVIGRE